jgi:predicted porin
MNRKIFAISLIAAMTSSSAFADSGTVEIYGVAAMSLDSIDNGTTAAVQGTRVTKISSDATRIGFRGAQDLAEGITGVWQIESLINLDGTGTSTFATRNSFLGLKNGMGTLLLGRYDSPYKISTRKLDVFGLVLADNRSLMGGVTGKSAWLGFDGRRTDTVVYLSPVVEGFSLDVSYDAGAESASQASQAKGYAWSLAGMYRLNGLYATLAYETHKLGSAATGTLAGTAAGNFAGAGSRESAAKLGLGYTLDAFALSLVYEKSSDTLGGAGATVPVAGCTAAGQNCYGHSAYYLAGKYRIGSDDAVKLAYGRAGRLAGAAAGSDTSAHQISFGYDHSLNKETTLYGLYTRLSNGAAINYALASSSWTTGATAAAGNGATLSALSFGINYVF